MGFKSFQGLLQIAVALSFAEWMTKTNISQDQYPYYLPQDFTVGQGISTLPQHQQADPLQLSRHITPAPKEQGLLDQLLSLSSACNRGDISSGYDPCSAWPVEAQSDVSGPLTSFPDDFGYVSGSESPSPPSVVPSFSANKSPNTSPFQGLGELGSSSNVYGDPGEVESCGASCLPTSSDFDNINIVDLVTDTDYETFDITDSALSPPKKETSLIQEVFSFSPSQKAKAEVDISSIIDGASKYSSAETENFYTPLQNGNGDYDPFLLDFGRSSSSTSDEEFPDDLVEALSTFDKYFKTIPDIPTRPKAGSQTSPPDLNKEEKFFEMTGFPELLEERPRQGIVSVKGEVDSSCGVDLPQFVSDNQEGEKQDWASVAESSLFDIPDSFVDSLLVADGTTEKESFLSEVGKAKTVVNVGEDFHSYKGKGARPKVAKFPGLSYNEDDLIHMPVEKFNSVIETLDVDTANRAKDVRRKGKNKIAARNCRKRKLDAINDLDSEIVQVDSDRKSLLAEQEALERDLKEIRKKTDFLYDYIFDSLRDENGLPYSREHFSLQYTSDGSVYLVPSTKQLNGSSTISRKQNQVL